MANSEHEILSEEGLREKYRDFYARGSPTPVQRAKVPEELWPLVPYAEFWGIVDDGARERLVRSAPADVLENLRQVVQQFEDALDAWLAGSEASRSPPSREYLAFSALRMAADLA